MNTALEFPKENFAKKCLLVFTLEESALSADWRIVSFTQSLLISLIVGFITWFAEGVIRDYFIVFSVLVGVAYYVIDFTTVKNYRKKIIADMKSAGNFKGTFSFHGGAFRGQTIVYVPTMAGELNFICYGDATGLIQKKRGRFFYYYTYHDRDIDSMIKKDLRIFIAGESKLDVVPGSILIHQKE